MRPEESEKQSMGDKSEQRILDKWHLALAFGEAWMYMIVDCKRANDYAISWIQI